MTLIEHTAPLPPASRAFIRSYFSAVASPSADLAVSEADRAFWASLRDPHSLDVLLDDADFYLIEGNILAVGQVPEDEKKVA